MFHTFLKTRLYKGCPKMIDKNCWMDEQWNQLRLNQRDHVEWFITDRTSTKRSLWLTQKPRYSNFHKMCSLVYYETWDMEKEVRFPHPPCFSTCIIMWCCWVGRLQRMCIEKYDVLFTFCSHIYTILWLVFSYFFSCHNGRRFWHQDGTVCGYLLLCMEG